MSSNPYYTGSGKRLYTEEEVSDYFQQLISQYEDYYQQLLLQYQQAAPGFDPTAFTQISQKEMRKYESDARKAQIEACQTTLAQIKEYEKSIKDEIKRLESEQAEAETENQGETEEK